MSLISLEYAVFVAVAALLFQMSARPKRPAMLCVISLLFCALNSVGAAVALLIATAMTFLFGRWIEKASDGRQRRILLGMAVAILLGHLALVKVVPHLSRMDQGEWLPQMLATFGTSYYTLKLIGYLIDVFWGRYRAWPDPVYFGAFATFFPLLPAGPIQRANEFSLPQDDGSIAEQMVYGLRRVLFGLVKKLLVADRLGGIVDYIAAGQPQHANLLWVMAYLFPLQLYVDFSALSDIGIGAAAIFGIRAPENFAFPFFAPSIGEFWRRWHMSLTRWLGDYVFTPLRMATRAWGNVGLAISIVVNMALIGMWHAVSFGWLLFGLINAAFLTADALTTRLRRKLYKKRPWTSWVAALLGPVLVFHMIAISLVCFRAQTLPDIAYFFGNLLDGLSAPIAALSQLFYSFGRGRCAYAFVAISSFMVLEGWLYLRVRSWGPLTLLPRFGQWPRPVRWAVYYIALLAVGIASQQSARFIYVQF
jgi:hypothetical protein